MTGGIPSRSPCSQQIWPGRLALTLLPPCPSLVLGALVGGEPGWGLSSAIAGTSGFSPRTASTEYLGRAFHLSELEGLVIGALDDLKLIPERATPQSGKSGRPKLHLAPHIPPLKLFLSLGQPFCYRNSK